MGEPTVLLVTPFDDERAIYADSLRAEGFDVLLADGPDHALVLAATAAPHVVVTRIFQTGQSTHGLHLVRQLKTGSASGHMPVVVVTSLMQPELRADAEAAGCDAYLLLPIFPDALIAEIRRVLTGATRSVA